MPLAPFRDTLSASCIAQHHASIFVHAAGVVNCVRSSYNATGLL